MDKIKRINTKKLFEYSGLTEKQKDNSMLNISESDKGLQMLKSYPRRIVLELTNACNLGCIMCGRNHSDFKPHFFNIEWLDALKPVMEYAEEITLMGWGEPTIHPDFRSILEFAAQYPIKKYMLTNGVKLRDISPWIFEYDVNIVAVSLDGPDETTNNIIRRGSDFNAIVSNIRELVKRRSISSSKPYINTVTTLMKSNLDKFPDMIDLAASLGIEEVKGVYLTAFSKSLAEETLFDIPDKTREIFSIAAKRAEKHNIVLSLPHIPGEDPSGQSSHKYCHLAWRDLFIGCDGIIRTCMSSKNTLCKLPEQDFDFMSDLWNSSPFIDFRTRVNSHNNDMNPACQYCYQSSCANWNKKHSFIHLNNDFHPEWGESDG